MIQTIFFWSFVALYAAFEAWGDHTDKLESDEELDHRALWRMRATVVGSVWCAVVGWGLFLQGPEWWMLLGMIGALPVFSAVHRMKFNRLDGRSPLYLGSTNLYDRFWIMLRGLDARNTSARHWQAYTRDTLYRQTIHAAARTAYAVEGAVLLACAVLVWVAR